MITLKMSITNDQGEVYAVLARDFNGAWVDKDGDFMFNDHGDQQHIGFEIQSLLVDAIKWREAQGV